MKYIFRDYMIKRTCNNHYADYHSYRNSLENDFHHRCAYCNLLDSMITTPFEIDHFIPRDAFKDSRPELETTYDNLIYACKKCNRAKGKQYSGDITNVTIENEFFYKPDVIDYASIFYRDVNGQICSDDILGNQMIVKLKLYNPIHNLAWICERLKSTKDKLSAKINDMSPEDKARQEFEKALNELEKYYSECRDYFIANYNKGTS